MRERDTHKIKLFHYHAQILKMLLFKKDFTKIGFANTYKKDLQTFHWCQKLNQNSKFHYHATILEMLLFKKDFIKVDFANTYKKDL